MIGVKHYSLCSIRGNLKNVSQQFIGEGEQARLM